MQGWQERLFSCIAADWKIAAHAWLQALLRCIEAWSSPHYNQIGAVPARITILPITQSASMIAMNDFAKRLNVVGGQWHTKKAQPESNSIHFSFSAGGVWSVCGQWNRRFENNFIPPVPARLSWRTRFFPGLTISTRGDEWVVVVNTCSGIEIRYHTRWLCLK